MKIKKNIWTDLKKKKNNFLNIPNYSFYHNISVICLCPVKLVGQWIIIFRSNLDLTLLLKPQELIEEIITFNQAVRAHNNNTMI